MFKINTRTTVSEIAEQLEADGFDPALAEQVLRAWTNGALVWTRDKLVTTDKSRISVSKRTA